MIGFLLRRAANWLVLVVLATSMAYFLAAGALDPRSNYEDRRPPPPPAVVDARLTQLNLNDETPLVERYLTWAGGVLHGDLGKTWEGEDVSDEIGRRIPVSMRLLLIATSSAACSASPPGPGAPYARTDRATTPSPWPRSAAAVPPFVLAVAAGDPRRCASTRWSARSFFEYTGEFTPGHGGGFFPQVVDRVQHLCCRR